MIAEDQPTALYFVLSSRMIDYSSIHPIICVMLSSQWEEALLGGPEPRTIRSTISLRPSGGTWRHINLRGHNALATKQRYEARQAPRVMRALPVLARTASTTPHRFCRARHGRSVDVGEGNLLLGLPSAKGMGVPKLTADAFFGSSASHFLRRPSRAVSRKSPAEDGVRAAIHLIEKHLAGVR
jgi:hypothetical protein